MKSLLKLIIILFVLVISTQIVSAQAPNLMSYQAVLRNSTGVLITNAAVSVKISILQGSLVGTSVFEELHYTTTNVNGLITIAIGGGTNLTGSVSSINWANGPFFIKTDTDPTGGVNFTISGTSQLLSVPYALYANFAANGQQGQQGIQGAAGSQGIQGGIGLTGPPGPTGAIGSQGVPGPAGNGIVNTVNNNNGTFTITYTNGTTYTSNIMAGPVGPAGPTGNPGSQGIQGSIGQTGAIGTTGLTGANGIQGIQGPIGQTGLTGATGANGTQGIQGPIGLPGPSGPTGATGAAGAQGIQGIQGLSGYSGRYFLGKDTLGGIVFYIYKGSDNLQHGLIVSKTELIERWQTVGALVNASTSWDGSGNMGLMTNSPAKTWVQTQFPTGNWYIPSLDEMNLLWIGRMHVNKTLNIIGQTLLSKTFTYWTSTEVTAANAYRFSFLTGAPTSAVKTANNYVRAIRAF